MLIDWNNMPHKPTRNQVHFTVTRRVILYSSLSTLRRYSAVKSIKPDWQIMLWKELSPRRNTLQRLIPTENTFNTEQWCDCNNNRETNVLHWWRGFSLALLSPLTHPGNRVTGVTERRHWAFLPLSPPVTSLSNIGRRLAYIFLMYL